MSSRMKYPACGREMGPRVRCPACGRETLPGDLQADFGNKICPAVNASFFIRTWIENRL